MTKQIEQHCKLCNTLYTPKDKYQELCDCCTPIKRDYEVEAIGKALRDSVNTFQDNPLR